MHRIAYSQTEEYHSHTESYYHTYDTRLDDTIWREMIPPHTFRVLTWLSLNPTRNKSNTMDTSTTHISNRRSGEADAAQHFHSQQPINSSHLFGVSVSVFRYLVHLDFNLTLLSDFDFLDSTSRFFLSAVSSWLDYYLICLIITLYHHHTFLGAFNNRQLAIFYTRAY